MAENKHYESGMVGVSEICDSCKDCTRLLHRFAVVFNIATFSGNCDLDFSCSFCKKCFRTDNPDHRPKNTSKDNCRFSSVLRLADPV